MGGARGEAARLGPWRLPTPAPPPPVLNAYVVVHLEPVADHRSHRGRRRVGDGHAKVDPI
jgi:hypothetical protein